MANGSVEQKELIATYVPKYEYIRVLHTASEREDRNAEHPRGLYGGERPGERERNVPRVLVQAVRAEQRGAAVGRDPRVHRSGARETRGVHDVRHRERGVRAHLTAPERHRLRHGDARAVRHVARRVRGALPPARVLVVVRVLRRALRT